MADSDISLPPEGVKEPIFIGRSNELSVLTSLRAEIVEENSRMAVCLIDGPSGIGKTSLVHYFMRLLKNTGAICGYGEILDNAALPIEAIYDVSKSIIREIQHHPNEDLRRLKDRVLSNSPEAVQTLVSSLGDDKFGWASIEDLKDAEGIVDAKQSFISVTNRICEELPSRQHPLVICYDNFHWVDEDTAEIIESPVFKNRLHHSLLIVCYDSLKLHKDSVGDRFLGKLMCLPHEKLVLEPFTLSELKEFEEANFPDVGLSIDQLRVLLRKTKGLPLVAMHHFTQARKDIEQGSPVVVDDLDWSDPIAALDNLLYWGPTDHHKGILFLLSIINYQLSLKSIARIIGLSTEVCASIMEEMLAAKWISVNNKRYRISHEILRQKILLGMPEALRRRTTIKVVSGLRNILKTGDSEKALLSYARLLRENRAWMGTNADSELTKVLVRLCDLLIKRSASHALANWVEYGLSLDAYPDESGISVRLIVSGCLSAADLADWDRLGMLRERSKSMSLSQVDSLIIEQCWLRKLLSFGDIKGAFEICLRSLHTLGYRAPEHTPPRPLLKMITFWQILKLNHTKPGNLRVNPTPEAKILANMIASCLLAENFDMYGTHNALSLWAVSDLRSPIYQFDRPTALANFAALANALGFYQKSISFIHEAIALCSDESNTTYAKLRVLVLAYAHVVNHEVSLNKAASILEQCKVGLLMLGDKVYASHAKYAALSFRLHAGNPLVTLNQIEKGSRLEIHGDIHQGNVEKRNLVLQMIHNLCQSNYGNHLILEGPHYDDAVVKSKAWRTKDRDIHREYCLVKGLLFTLFEQPKRAWESLSLIDTSGIRHDINGYVICFLKGLALYELIIQKKLSKTDLEKPRAEFKSILKDLHNVMHRNVDFIFGKILILEGLWKDLEDNHVAALELLSEATLESTRQERLHETYLCHRLKTRILLRRENLSDGLSELKASIATAQVWGASNLVIYLERTMARLDDRMESDTNLKRPSTEKIEFAMLSEMDRQKSAKIMCRWLSEQWKEVRWVLVMQSRNEQQIRIEQVWHGSIALGLETEDPYQIIDKSLVYEAIRKRGPVWSQKGRKDIYTRDKTAWCMRLSKNDSMEKFVLCAVIKNSSDSRIDGQLREVERELLALLPTWRLIEDKHQVSQDALRFRRLCDESPVGIIQISKYGEILYTNDRIGNWLSGYETVITGSSINVNNTAWCKRLKLDELLSRVNEGQHSSVTFQDVVILGETLGLKDLMLLMTATKSDPDLIDIVVTNITYTQEARNEKLRRQSAEEKTKEVERQFVMLGHELREPVSVLVGQALELEESVSHKNSGQREELQRIINSGLRLSKIINDIFSVIDSTHFKVSGRAHPIRLAESVMRFGENIASLVTSYKKDITFIKHDDDVWVNMDPVHLERILFNLIQNSLKYTGDEGKIEIEIQSEDASATVYVRDNGIGIPDGEMGKVQELFYRSKSANKHAPGMGLGLFIVNGLVSAYSGRLDLNNRSEGGLEVSIHLPRLQDTQQADVKHLEFDDSSLEVLRKTELGFMKAYAEGDDETQMPSGHGEADQETKILVVEDDPNLRKLLCSMLRKQYRVWDAQDTLLARSLLKHLTPDLILIDINLPGEDGISFLKYLRKNLQIPTPLVVITGSTLDRTIQNAWDEGADDVIKKPFNGKELRMRMQTLIKLYRKDREVSLMTRQMQLYIMQLERSNKAIQSAEATLIHTEKEKFLAMISAGILHEIKNALNNTKMALECVLMDDDLKPINRTNLNSAIEQQNNILDMAEDIRSFANPDLVYSARQIDLIELIQRALKYLKRDLGDIMVIFEARIGKTKMKGFESMISHLLINMLSNSIRAIREKHHDSGEGMIRLIVTCDDDFITIFHEDNGKEIGPDAKRHLFNLHQSEERDVGSFSIALCREYALKHGGDIYLESSSDAGNQFKITLRRS